MRPVLFSVVLLAACARAPADDCARPAALDEGPVVRAARPLPPISGGTLVVLADRTVVAADPDRDVVWILDPATDAVRSVSLTAGDEPGRVTEGPAGRAFVALRGSGAVAEVDVGTGSVVARHAACPSPRGLAWSNAKQTLTVACANGTLARLGPNGRVLQHPADDLRDVVQRKDDVLVSTFRGARLLSVTDDGTAVPLPSDVAGRSVAWRVAAGPSGQIVMLNQRTARGVAADACGVVAYGDGQTAIVQSELTSASGATLARPTGAVLAVDVAVGTDGRWAIASAGNRTVLRETGEVLSGVGEPIAVAFRGPDTLVVFSREPAQLALVTGDAEPVIVPLAAASVRDTAHGLFHRATPAGLACASCHPEVGDDGTVWAFPEGPRRTQPLRGGLKATAPFHWLGDRADMTALLTDVMGARMHAAVPSRDAADALVDWLDRVPAPAPPSNLDGAAVARGRVAFDAACADCHAGPLGSDNAAHDVGTGGAFHTPRLVGLAGRGPYLHDGSAPSLRARVEEAGDRHGRTDALSAADRADLAEYLRSR